jgi:hypothetical protein
MASNSQNHGMYFSDREKAGQSDSPSEGFYALGGVGPCFGKQEIGEQEIGEQEIGEQEIGEQEIGEQRVVEDRELTDREQALFSSSSGHTELGAREMELAARRTKDRL